MARTGPWGDNPPKRPRVGAGREALAKRARKPRESRRTAEAARRGLRRSKVGRPTKVGPIRGAAAKLRGFTGVVEQSFLSRRRLRHLLLALAAVWALWTFAIGDAGIPRWLNVRHKNTQISREIEAMRAQEAELRTRVDALSDARDQKALEKVAYEEHALVRKDEVLVRYYEEGE